MAAISIVMPLFNKADQVVACINSIQRQCVKDWELVVVDDGSLDSSADIVKSFNDSRIKVYSQPNNGVSVARNRGVKLASTDLVAFIDADDLWAPEFLSSVLALSREFPEAGWFASSYEIHETDGSSRNCRIQGLESGFSRGMLLNYFAIAIQSEPPVCSSAVAVRRGAFNEIGGFPEGIGNGEDLVTWAKLAVKFPLAYDRRPLATYRISGIFRKPDPSKQVGQMLLNLADENPSVKGLREYVGLWFRMQSVAALRADQRKTAIRFGLRSVIYSPFRLRNTYTLFLTFLPRMFRLTLDSQLRRLLRR